MVAHRGASHDLAEHTLGAYLAAMEAGAEAFECDVRLTADGHLVCVHDRNLWRTASKRGAISTMELADLDALDFASWKNPWADLDDEAPEPDAEHGRVLTLRKLLETVADQDRPDRGGDRDQAPDPVRRAGRAPAGRAAARLRLGPGRLAGAGDELLRGRRCSGCSGWPRRSRW